MKRVLTAVLALSLTAGLVGCAGASTSTNQAAGDNKTAAAETKTDAKKDDAKKDDAAKEDDKKDDTKKDAESVLVEGAKPYELKVSKDNIGEMTEEEVKAQAKQEGFDDAVKNDDGSYTLKMNEESAVKKIKEVKEQVDAAIEELKAGNDAVKCVKEITYNDTLTEMNVNVDKAQFDEEAQTNLTSMLLPMAGIQALKGVDQKDIDVKINFIDASNNQNIKTLTYQEVANAN
ncbi:MAG: hypothetical protein HUJ55_08240 [Ileibacterium sp.]|nr:hypothetical protein [Ileibacterium sp.]